MRETHPTIDNQVGCIPCTANTIGESKKHAVGLIGENDEILMVRKTHPTIDNQVGCIPCTANTIGE